MAEGIPKVCGQRHRVARMVNKVCIKTPSQHRNRYIDKEQDVGHGDNRAFSHGVNHLVLVFLTRESYQHDRNAHHQTVCYGGTVREHIDVEAGRLTCRNGKAAGAKEHQSRRQQPDADALTHVRQQIISFHIHFVLLFDGTNVNYILQKYKSK